MLVTLQNKQGSSEEAGHDRDQPKGLTELNSRHSSASSSGARLSTPRASGGCTCKASVDSARGTSGGTSRHICSATRSRRRHAARDGGGVDPSRILSTARVV